MLKGQKLYAVLGGLGALALILVGLGGVSIVAAQEVEEAPGMRVWGERPGLFSFGRGEDWIMFDTAADVLGLTPEELFAELHAGNTMEEIAEGQGVDLEAMQESLGAAREESQRDRITQAVEDGTMSQEKADWLLEGLDKGYTTGQRGRDFGGGDGRGGPGRFPGPGGEPLTSE